MKVYRTIVAFREALDEQRKIGKKIGLVPTMGYLHAGHVSLIEEAVKQNDVVAVTLFVNPLQFGANEDLSVYPRDEIGDIATCEAAQATMLFIPTVEEMYPSTVYTKVMVEKISETMEGAARPTHFSGVATVVTKLFAIAGACNAYFGEKDFQQIAVIKQLVRDLSFPVTIIPCPIIRENDGLALSSRNVYLTPQQRKAAPCIYASLQAGLHSVQHGERRASEIIETIKQHLETQHEGEVEYITAVDARTLQPCTVLVGEIRLLTVVRFGKTRLLDNVGITVLDD